MTIHISDEGNIGLDDMRDWKAFAADNRQVLVETYGSIKLALNHLRNGGLTIGGGAAPLFNVYFRRTEPCAR